MINIISAMSEEMKVFYDLIHSHHIFRSQLDDPGHRVPRFSSMSWGMCVPGACSSVDIEKIASGMLNRFVDTDKISVSVSVDPELCQVERGSFESNGSIVVGMLFFFMIGLVTYATVCDMKAENNANEIVMSFSLKNTMKTIFSLERSNDDIKAVHGIRFLNSLMLLFSHNSMAIFFYPYLNRTEMAESLGTPFSVTGRAASLYTDPFIMFSGLLTYYSIVGRIEHNKTVNIAKEYIGRLFRLIPTLSALILFCTWILPELGSGPQFPLVVDHHADICKKYWWRNYFFIHNYFGFENMCLTHTHHIGIDTQLFIIGVPIVILMGLQKKYANRILYILIALATLSTIARFYVSYTMNMANFVYFGATVQQLFKTANRMYILPAHRFTVYVMGILLAKVLRYTPTKRLTQNQLFIGWTIATALFCAAFFGPISMSCIGYKYSSFHNAIFAAFAPIAWCYSFAWIVYTTHHGYNSLLGDVFSWRGFLVWTRLSYAVYLTQFPVYFFNIGITRTPQYYDFYGALFNMKEFACIIFLSIVLTVIFDLPFQNIKNIIFNNKKKLQENSKIKKID
ncbi:drop dead isoform X2 [Arctopsyche grandis]|uniref:drop dead isoform X2 n=1 Tax=Arctopsyche grandis TaxID=121162 RepID=UPI00406D799D